MADAAQRVLPRVLGMSDILTRVHAATHKNFLLQCHARALRDPSAAVPSAGTFRSFMTPEIFAFFLLLPARAALSLTERALAQARRAQLRPLAAHRRSARLALKATARQAQLAPILRSFLLATDLLIGASAVLALGTHPAGAENPPVTAAVLAALLLVWLVGELLPRQVARRHPETIVRWASFPLGFLLRLLDVLPHRGGAESASRLAADTRGTGSTHGQEVAIPARQSNELDDPQERALVDRLIRLGERTAETLMTPRTRIAWLDLTAPREENLQVLRENPYSRYPVYRGTDNDVVGILETRALARLLSRDGASDLFGELLAPIFVSESTLALTLLETFRDEGSHMALVVDEYGDLQGLVTLDDLLGAVVGQFHQQEEEAGADARVIEREDGSWLVDGGLSSEDLRELLRLDALPAEQDHDFNTAAGMVVARFGRIPAPGESFEHAGWRIEVVDLDGARVDKLLIQRQPPAPDAAPDA